MSGVRLSRRALLRAAAPAAGFVVATAASGGARAAPKAELWARWQAHDPAADTAIDHDAWDRLLAAYSVPGRDGITRFAYARLAASPDRNRLDDYVAGLAGVPISDHSRGQQLAYWLNLYNALTVKLILDHYPVASIRDIDISPGLFADGPWGRPLLSVEGEAVSLDDIEHRILRPIWADPKIHYGVNCASLGCPNLPPRAFRSGTTERMLDQGGRAFVNHPRGARVDAGRLVVSSIYVWFQEDFGGSDAGVIEHLGRYAQPPLARALTGVARIADHDYDWSLNDAAAPAP